MRTPKYKFVAILCVLFVVAGGIAPSNSHICLEHGEHEANHNHAHNHVKHVHIQCDAKHSTSDIASESKSDTKSESRHFHIEVEECACLVLPVPLVMIHSKTKAIKKLLLALPTFQKITSGATAFSRPSISAETIGISDTLTSRRSVVLLI